MIKSLLIYADVRIDEMPSEMFRETAKNDPVVIVPIGATEAHGPHLPLGTDTFQPEYIASRIAERMDNVLIAPTLPYGQHSTAKNVSGTIDLTFDTLRSVVRDILNALIRHGIRRILIISGHAGTSHMTAINEACRETAERHPDAFITAISDFFVAEKCDAMDGIDGDGHAGFAETSRIMHIRPELVGNERPSGKYKISGRVLGDASACMPDGVVGISSGASEGSGKKINDFIVDTIMRMISC